MKVPDQLNDPIQYYIQNIKLANFSYMKLYFKYKKHSTSHILMKNNVFVFSFGPLLESYGLYVFGITEYNRYVLQSSNDVKLFFFISEVLSLLKLII